MSVKLSIVMPCYNVEPTIKRALDSILMQRVDFEYEIIVVDDASTDNTQVVLSKYASKDSRIKILTNQSNLGNAKAFKRGSEASAGDYLCVLDGDDFYTVKDKLQKQVDFLDGDKERQYAAVAHKYIMLNPDGTIQADERLFHPARDFSYLDFITQQFYFHTSSMMYRNVFRGLEIPILDIQRGDTIRTMIALNATNGRVKILNFVGSVYCVNRQGIWTSLDDEKKKKMNMDTWTNCINYAGSKTEKKILQKQLNLMRYRQVGSNLKSWPIEPILNFLSSGIVKPAALDDSDFISRKLYKSAFIDSFCETLGFIQKGRLDIQASISPNKDSIVIVVSELNKKDDGISQEILELATMMQSKRITIILTGMASLNDLKQDIKAALAKLKNLNFLFLKNSGNKLEAIQKKLAEINPGKIYWYCGQNNTLADAALQDYGAKNIVLFSLDRALALGLENSNVDLFVAKTPQDYKLLSERYKDRVIYIPCWSKRADYDGSYEAFNGHDKLNTATAAPSFNMFQDDILGSFQFFIINLLKATGGRHIHFGQLPDDIKNGIMRALKRNGLPEDSFVHAEWNDNLPDSIISHDVDIFISPFPITNIKLDLQCISAGIPLLMYAGGLTHMENNYFPNFYTLRWRDRKEFFAAIMSLSKEKLTALSKSGIEYFNTHNDLSVAMPHVLFDKSFDSVPIPQRFIDNSIIDIDNVLDLLNHDRLQ